MSVSQETKDVVLKSEIALKAIKSTFFYGLIIAILFFWVYAIFSNVIKFKPSLTRLDLVLSMFLTMFVVLFLKCVAAFVDLLACARDIVEDNTVAYYHNELQYTIFCGAIMLLISIFLFSWLVDPIGIISLCVMCILPTGLAVLPIASSNSLCDNDNRAEFIKNAIAYSKQLAPNSLDNSND